MNSLVREIIQGKKISKEEAMRLWDEDVDVLAKGADEIRRHFCGSTFDLCTIINAKSGNCSEDCRFCAQSAHHGGEDIPVFSFLEEDEIVEDAKKNERLGVGRYSLVTSGKKLSSQDVLRSGKTAERIGRETGLKVCVSHGLLNQEELQTLKDHGVVRVHNNLESSPGYFPQVCSTHTMEEKIRTIRWAKDVGLEVCSGGIIGMGESRKDRVDMAFSLRELDVDSIPINVLNPIPGTPMGDRPVLEKEEVRKTIAIFRFIHPDKVIRLAGGRALFEDKGESFFRGGANGCITGDMLTTAGIHTVDDVAFQQQYE